MKKINKKFKSIKFGVISIAYTKCSKGGYHRGKMLERCHKCGKLLTYEDFKSPYTTSSTTSITPGITKVQDSNKWVEVKRRPVGDKVEIICIDCGKPRLIKPQDVWQVKRCKNCQSKKNKRKFKKFIQKVTQ